MKLIIRNFLTLLKRFRLASTLNILGLAVAFAAFTVILMQVNYERGFDKFHSKADRIYRLEGLDTDHERAYFASTHSRPVIDEFIRSSPHIRTGTLVSDWGQQYITVERNGAKTGFFEYSRPCFPEIVQIFDFKMIEGDTSVMRKPAYALISSSMAERLYGTEPALDKQFTSAGTTFTVGGVYRDFPRNSQLKNGFYFNFGPGATNDWANQNYKAYILLDDPAHKEAVVENHRQNYVHKENDPYHYANDYRLNLLSDVFYSNDVDGMSPETNGDRSQTRLLLIVAFLVIAIAAINFVNFATALTPMRIKSINTQKVLGSPNSHLRWGLIFEAVGISLIAYLIALIIVYLLSVSSFATLITADMTLQANGHLLLLTAGVALAIGFIAGSYPAWYITSFPPALVLKGSFGLSPKGRKLRTVLISIQFIVSIILIISLLFVKLQTRYMKTTPAGYDRDNIAVVELSPEIAKTQTEVLSNRLKEYAAVEDVTFAHQLLGGSDDYMSWGRGYKDGNIHFNAFPVSPDFLKFMRIHIAEGRDFNESDLLKPDSEGTLVINRTMQQEYGLKLGDIIRRNMEVVGIIDDINYTSMRKPIEAQVFALQPDIFKYKRLLSYCYVRLRPGTDLPVAVEQIKKTVASLDPAYPTDVRFFDNVLDTLYKNELRLDRQITLFSLLAIIISIIGVFGLVIFDTQYRRGEIGVRKVFGATVGEILAMFNKTYVRIIAVCFVIAAPIAYYEVSLWLKNFASRTPIHIWVFAAALLIVLSITLLTVTLQSYKAATENPAKAVKSE